MKLFIRRLFGEKAWVRLGKIFEEDIENDAEKDSRKQLLLVHRLNMVDTKNLVEALKPVLLIFMTSPSSLIQTGLSNIQQSLQMEYKDYNIPDFPEFQSFQELTNYMLLSIFQNKVSILLFAPSLAHSFLPPSSGWSAVSFESPTFSDDPHLSVHMIKGKNRQNFDVFGALNVFRNLLVALLY